MTVVPEIRTGGRRPRLLILCYFFPPLAGGGVHRVLSFVHELPKLGWDCTVICAGREDYWVTDETLEGRIPPETEVIRVEGGSALSAWLRMRKGARGSRSGATFSALRRLSDWWLLPDSYVGWAKRARRALDRRLAKGGIDAVLSSSPPDSVHLAALGARRAGVPWIADFRDPWIGLHLRRPVSAWHRGRQAAMERSVLAGADLVLAASRTHADLIGAAAVKPAALAHLPNGYAPEEGTAEGAGEAAAEWTSGAPHATAENTGVAATRATSSPAAHFIAAFTGTLSMMPETEVFLEAVHDLLAKRPELRRRFRAKLAGPFDTGYRDRAIALGLTGIVEFTGSLAHGDSRALQGSADLLLLWKPPTMPTMVPGKLYEYLASGRPMVALLPAGDEAAALAVRGGAVRVDPGDRAALCAELERQVDRWLASGPAPDARPPWLAEHARPQLARRLAGELDRLVAASARCRS